MKSCFCLFTCAFLFQLIYVHSTSLVPSASKSEIPYEEEFRAYQDDLIKSIPSISRSKRGVYLNTDTTSAVAILLGVPLTAVLPSLSNFFNKWRKRRSVRDTSELEYDYNDNPDVQPLLDKISTYFELVDIPEHSCQVRAICEFSARPEKFYPLSEMIISRIRDPSLPAMVYLENDTNSFRTNHRNDSGDATNSVKSLLKVYNDALDEGSHNGEEKCQTRYGRDCQYSMDKLLNMPTLRFWTAMQKLLRIQFKEGQLM